MLRKKSKDIEAIIDVIPACVSFVDLEYRYQLNNKVYESWFGFTQKELCGKHVKFVLGEEQFKSLLPLFKKVFNGEVVRFEQTMNLKNERHLRVTYLPSYNYLEKVNGIFVFAEDLTDLKNNQEKLELSNRSLESFAHIVSHDIKSPLKTILSFGNLIKQDLANKKVVYKNEYLDFMIDSAQRLENLTGDLLSYAKVQNSNDTEDHVCSLQKIYKLLLTTCMLL